MYNTPSFSGKIVISGIGLISSCGKDLANFYNSIFKQDFYGENFSILKNNKRFKEIDNDSTLINFDKNLSELSKWVIYCIQKGLEDSDLTMDDLVKYRTKIFLGSFLGEIGGLRKESNAILPSFDRVSKDILKYFKLDVQSIVISSACASSSFAIGLGYQSIRSGMVDIVIAGGYERIGDYAFVGMKSLKTLSSEIKPFDIKRNGTFLGEGAGIVIMEKEEVALLRKTKIHSQILGFGISNDSHHIVRPDTSGTGIANSIKESLNNDTNLLSRVDYINAHGTGTFYNDIAESNGIKLAGINKVPVSSIKPVIGHTLGAAGVLECIASILAIEYKMLPPNINCNNQDKECDLFLVKKHEHKKKVNIAISNSIGFGGVNCTLALGAYNNSIPFAFNKTNAKQTNFVVSNYVVTEILPDLDTPDLLGNINLTIQNLFEKSKLINTDTKNCGIIIDLKEGLTKSQFLFMDRLVNKGVRLASPTLFTQSFPGFFVGEICIKYKIQGPCVTICDSKPNIESLILVSRILLAKGNINKLIVGKVFDTKLLFFTVENKAQSKSKGLIEAITIDDFLCKTKDLCFEYAV